MHDLKRGDRIVINFDKVSELGFLGLQRLSLVRKSKLYAYFERFSQFGMAFITFSIGKQGKATTIYLPTSCFTVYVKKSGHPATQIFL